MNDKEILNNLYTKMNDQKISIKTLKIYNPYKTELDGFRKIKNYDEITIIGSKDYLDLIKEDYLYQSQDIIIILRDLNIVSHTLIIETNYPFLFLIIPPVLKEILSINDIKCYKIPLEYISLLLNIDNLENNPKLLLKK